MFLPSSWLGSALMALPYEADPCLEIGSRLLLPPIHLESNIRFCDLSQKVKKKKRCKNVAQRWWWFGGSSLRRCLASSQPLLEKTPSSARSDLLTVEDDGGWERGRNLRVFWVFYNKKNRERSCREGGMSLHEM